MKKIILLATLASAPLAAKTAPPVPTERDVRELTAFFIEIDADRSGRLTKPEMSAFGTRHGMGPIISRKGWADIDANRDGKLTKSEFIQGMVTARAKRQAKQAK